jgi:putative ABC transport system substrate-binding protein
MIKKTYALVSVMVLAALLLGACGGGDKKSDKTYTIGVLIQIPPLEPVLDGFKAGMSELGYVEGKNVVYVYDGPTNTDAALKPEAEKLKSKKPDLLFTSGNPAALAAKEVFAGTDVPIVFAPVISPDQEGLVASLRNPGGNITGVTLPATSGKALEWLLQIVPGVQRVYVPYDPQEMAGVQSLQPLIDAAQVLNVKLVTAEGSTPEELDAITQTIPENVDAAFLLTSENLLARGTSLVQAANERRIPVAAPALNELWSSGVMIAYAPDLFEIGQQTARLADKILKGTKPATLPVEVAEAFLGINLQTAQTIGVEVPDEILSQAKQIVRPPSE